jgi:hypothetical protein
MPHFLSWVTEKFQLPFDGVGVLDANWNSLVAIKVVD